MKQLLVIAACTFFISCTDAGEGSADSERDTSEVTKNNANSQEAKEEQNKATAMRVIDGYNNRNTDEIFAGIDSGYTEYGEGSMPPMRYSDSMKTNLQSFMDAFPDLKGSDFITVADGDYVIVYGTWSGTWKKDFMGMKATGKSFKVQDADIFKFNEHGKITEHRGIQSHETLAKQIGMKMQ